MARESRPNTIQTRSFDGAHDSIDALVAIQYDTAAAPASSVISRVYSFMKADFTTFHATRRPA